MIAEKENWFSSIISVSDSIDCIFVCAQVHSIFAKQIRAMQSSIIVEQFYFSMCIWLHIANNCSVITLIFADQVPVAGASSFSFMVLEYAVGILQLIDRLCNILYVQVHIYILPAAVSYLFACYCPSLGMGKAGSPLQFEVVSAGPFMLDFSRGRALQLSCLC